jgi:hypothetical protein
VGPSVDLYNVLLFAVGQLNIIKIRYSTAHDLFLHVLQSVILIILEFVFFLLYVVFLAIKADNSSVMSSFIHAKP